MGKPSAPAPPDPRETSAAQTGTNIGTTIASNTMGMVDQYNPYGSLEYDQTGTYTYHDPYTGETYDIPTYRSVQEFSPGGAAINDANMQTQYNLAQTAQNQSDFLYGYLGEGFNPDPLPGFNDLPTVPGMAPRQSAQQPTQESRTMGQQQPGQPPMLRTQQQPMRPQQLPQQSNYTQQAGPLPLPTGPVAPPLPQPDPAPTPAPAPAGRSNAQQQLPEWARNYPGAGGAPSIAENRSTQNMSPSSRQYQVNNGYRQLGDRINAAQGQQTRTAGPMQPDVSPPPPYASSAPQPSSWNNPPSTPPPSSWGVPGAGDKMGSRTAGPMKPDVQPKAPSNVAPQATNQQQLMQSSSAARPQMGAPVASTGYQAPPPTMQGALMRPQGGAPVASPGLQATPRAAFQQDQVPAQRTAGGMAPDQGITNSPVTMQEPTPGAATVDLQTSYGPENFADNRATVEQALMERMNPQIDRDREQMRTQMANSGISLGSDAYSAANSDFERSVNDARLGAVLAGGEEQSRLANLERDQAGFGNSAQMAGAGFNNSVYNNQYQQQMGQLAFEDSRRQQALQEQLTRRNQPINEISALLSGSQVQAPNFNQFQPQAFPTTDVAANIWQNYDGQMQNYQNQNALSGNILGAMGKIAPLFF